MVNIGERPRKRENETGEIAEIRLYRLNHELKAFGIRHTHTYQTTVHSFLLFYFALHSCNSILWKSFEIKTH